MEYNAFGYGSQIKNEFIFKNEKTGKIEKTNKNGRAILEGRVSFYCCNCRSYYEVTKFLEIMSKKGYGLVYLNDNPEKNHLFFTVKEYREEIEKAKESGFISFGFNHNPNYLTLNTSNLSYSLYFDDWVKIYNI